MTDVFELGYQAFLSGETLAENPYDMRTDYVNWNNWRSGHQDAAFNNSAPLDL